MMKAMRFPTLWMLAAGSAAAFATSALAQGVTANHLKAAIVFNIIRFVDFPATGPSAPLDFCVAEGVAGVRELSSLDGQRAGNRPISFRLIDPPAVAGCDVVYLGAGATNHIGRVRQRGVLVVGENAEFTRAGGTVGLVRMGNQIRFEVNARSARESNLTISSKLLRLAARVQQ